MIIDKEKMTMEIDSDKPSCCGVPPDQLKISSPQCPDCGEKGQAVSEDTARHLVQEGLNTRMDEKDLMFCKTPSCSVVYYSPDGGPLFKKGDIRVRVGLKETEDPVWVCYCFEISKKDIWEEIERTGRSSASLRIRKEVEAGNCACEIKNPSGRCCLGEIRSAEKEFLMHIPQKSENISPFQRNNGTFMDWSQRDQQEACEPHGEHKTTS
ncbi:MAG: copper chaperone Copz family protein [Nitrospirae bacterium]|nr:copper chaperone Copz family protein [Nitrospirota bacterium]